MILDSVRLDGKNAFVSSSVEGLDAATALALAKAGASVAYHSPGDGLEEQIDQSGALGRKAAIYATDLTDPSACTGRIDATLKSSSSIAILANIAGAIPSSTTAEYEATDCDHAIAVHLTSVFRLAGAIEEQRKCR